jgi:hypothetical protein
MHVRRLRRRPSNKDRDRPVTPGVDRSADSMVAEHAAHVIPPIAIRHTLVDDTVTPPLLITENDEPPKR